MLNLLLWYYLMVINNILFSSLKISVQLQHHARHQLPTFQLIFVHVIESLVFVPVWYFFSLMSWKFCGCLDVSTQQISHILLISLLWSLQIMIGILFFLFEFYDDQLLAFLVLTLVWLCELFTMIRYCFHIHIAGMLYYFEEILF